MNEFCEDLVHSCSCLPSFPSKYVCLKYNTHVQLNVLYGMGHGMAHST